ncbi:hypothetical protein JTB14_021718 [Gonioctena quinquepunctata]|nr:hypothetical protein JTB14_021718 [Gonioctena quinquepunctata]
MYKRACKGPSNYPAVSSGSVVDPKIMLRPERRLCFVRKIEMPYGPSPVQNIENQNPLFCTMKDRNWIMQRTSIHLSWIDRSNMERLCGGH